jgi:hypothetical protein
LPVRLHPAARAPTNAALPATTQVSAPTSSNQTLEARQVTLESEIERWLDLYPRAVDGQPGSRSTTSTALSLTYAPNSTRSNATRATRRVDTTVIERCSSEPLKRSTVLPPSAAWRL